MTALAAEIFADAGFTVASDADTGEWMLKLDGAWITQRVGPVDQMLRALELPAQGKAII